MVVPSVQKSIAIRGLDHRLYGEVFALAKKDGKKVSDVVNLALRYYVENTSEYNGEYLKKLGSVDNDKFVLRNNGEISLSKDDILELEKEMGPFLIENTGKLKFEKDIDKSVIKNIEKIILKGGIVDIPKEIYTQVLIKSEIHGKMNKY